jgi:hypothetical protein
MTRPELITDDIVSGVERFVSLLYSRTCPLESVDKARKQLFSHRSENNGEYPTN